MNDSTVEEIVAKTLEAKRVADVEQVKSDLVKMGCILLGVYIGVKINNRRKTRKVRKSK